MSDLVKSSEQSTRNLLADRPDWLLLDLWEVTEVQREMFLRAGPSLGALAAVQLIDWILDELDGRYPRVLSLWSGLAEQGIDADLSEMFRMEVKRNG